MSVNLVGCDRICISIISPIRNNETSFLLFKIKSMGQVVVSWWDLLFQFSYFKMLYGVRIFLTTQAPHLFFSPEPHIKNTCITLKEQDQYLTSFYLFIFLLCSTDCCPHNGKLEEHEPCFLLRCLAVKY